MRKISLLKNISAIIYVIVGVLVGFYFYQYRDLAVYIAAIALSFVLLNTLVLYLYEGFKQKTMALMKFMGFNFLKDIIWAIFWMFIIKKEVVLIIYLALIFLLLSIPVYISVLVGIGNNEKSDKNQ